MVRDDCSDDDLIDLDDEDDDVSDDEDVGSEIQTLSTSRAVWTGAELDEYLATTCFKKKIGSDITDQSAIRLSVCSACPRKLSKASKTTTVHI